MQMITLGGLPTAVPDLFIEWLKEAKEAQKVIMKQNTGVEISQEEREVVRTFIRRTA